MGSNSETEGGPLIDMWLRSTLVVDFLGCIGYVKSWELKRRETVEKIEALRRLWSLKHHIRELCDPSV
jgi:hypothetical protein